LQSLVVDILDVLMLLLFHGLMRSEEAIARKAAGN
jgi:hypothetical protein